MVRTDGTHAMIVLGDTSGTVPPDVLRAPGAFAWWYADLVTPEGDGAVLIWSYGLPFLPGYADAARRGAPERPVDRPSVNLAVYRRGAPAFYLLQEHPPAPVERAGLAGVQEIGGCRFGRSVDAGQCTLGADLDCALPGTDERLTGTLRLRGVARGSGDRVDSAADATHVWTPMTGPAEGEISLRIGGRGFVEMRGRAYHDRNHGTVPLHALGIARWMWGRVPLPGREAVYYLLWPSDGGDPVFLGLEIGSDGVTREIELDAELGRERAAFGGLGRPERIVLRERATGRPWMEIAHRRTVDAGPFYLRMLSEGAATDGSRAMGWSELCVPSRVDLGAHRPFVRMRVHRAHGPNSPWLPLFAGPREGRPMRLLRHVFSRSER